MILTFNSSPFCLLIWCKFYVNDVYPNKKFYNHSMGKQRNFITFWCPDFLVTKSLEAHSLFCFSVSFSWERKQQKNNQWYLRLSVLSLFVAVGSSEVLHVCSDTFLESVHRPLAPQCTVVEVLYLKFFLQVILKFFPGIMVTSCCQSSQNQMRIKDLQSL